MKTFLISLERAKDRRERIIKDLNNLSLDYEVFDAVDGSKLTSNEIEKYCDLNYIEPRRNWFTNGVIGACLSHFYVYKEIIKRDLEYAFIIEDDAKLNQNIPIIIEKCKNEIKKNEIILLYYQSFGNTVKISNQNKIKLTGKYHLQYPYEATNLDAAGAYIITKEACQRMIDYILPIRQGADEWGVFYKNCLDSIRVVYPRPMETYDFRSTLSSLNDISQGKFTKAVNFINKYNIPVFHQLLSLKRKYNKTKKLSKFIVTNEKSRILER